MVRAEIRRRGLAVGRSIKHATHVPAIDYAAVYAKAHDPTRPLVHHDEHPVCAQDGGFAAKQIETPQTVFRVTEDREPGWPLRIRCRLAPRGEDAPHHVLVDRHAEGQGDLLRDPGTAPARIP